MRLQALDRTDNNNGMMVKPRNPVGRPRIHPRLPPPSSSAAAAASVPSTTTNTARRSTVTDDDIEEIDQWSNDRKRERDFPNGQTDDRLAWSKKSTATLSSTYSRNNRMNHHEPMGRSNQFIRGQNSLDSTRKAMPSVNTYSTVSRSKFGTVRTRGKSTENNDLIIDSIF